MHQQSNDAKAAQEDRDNAGDDRHPVHFSQDMDRKILLTQFFIRKRNLDQCPGHGDEQRDEKKVLDDGEQSEAVLSHHTLLATDLAHDH